MIIKIDLADIYIFKFLFLQEWPEESVLQLLRFNSPPERNQFFSTQMTMAAFVLIYNRINSLDSNYLF